MNRSPTSGLAVEEREVGLLLKEFFGIDRCIFTKGDRVLINSMWKLGHEPAIDPIFPPPK
jgi:hypothetical protein